MTIPTRPTGEQLRFVSALTGEHDLDAYLEAAEKGGRTLADILADLFDETTGDFRDDLFEFRINASTGRLQFRVGDYADPSTGWRDSVDNYIFRQRGAHANATAYERLDVVTYNNGIYICTAAHTSSSAIPGVNFAIALDGTALNAATLAAAGSASAAATSATNAATSATAAANSATAAGTSATNAANSATTATTQAGNASTSATNAANSASAASTSATNAATSATNAANSATAAANSAAAAATFNPALYATLSGATFTGGLIGTTLTLSGTATFNGNVVLGDASGDSVTINAATASIPNGLRLNSGDFSLSGSADPFGRFYGRSLGISSTSSAFIQINAATGSTAGIDFGVNGTRTAGLTSNTTETALSTLGATPLTFAINGTTGATLDTSRRLQIGGTGGASRFNVFGNGLDLFNLVPSSDALNYGTFRNAGGTAIGFLGGGGGGASGSGTADDFAIRYQSRLLFSYGGSAQGAMDSVGNFGWGTITPSSIGSGYRTLDIRGSTGGGIRFGNASNASTIYSEGSVIDYIGAISATEHRWFRGSTLNGKFDANGHFIVGQSSSATHTFAVSKNGNQALYVLNSDNIAPFGIYISYPSAAANDTSGWFLSCQDSSTNRFRVHSNGGVANYSANNVNLSDEREKPHIEPFDAAADLEAFLAFPFVNYKYADQTHDDWNLGTGAQSALASHPGNARFVDVDSWQKPVLDEEGKPVIGPDSKPLTESRMSVYDGDIHYRTGAQAQYAHRRINELEAENAALKGQIADILSRLAAAGL